MTVEVQTESMPLNNAHTQTVDPVALPGMSIDDFTYDPEFYTGLDSYLTFYDVLASLGPGAYHLTYFNGRTPTIKVQDQLFLTLMKCCTYKTNYELIRIFKISEPDVYSIFVTWIKFISLQ